MTTPVSDLLQRQQRDGFPDLLGTELTATIPIADRLINELIAGALPSGGKVREIVLQSDEDQRLTVKIRLSAAFLPPIPVALLIEEQPSLPGRPVVVLRLAQASGFGVLAGSAVSSFAKLPPGITVNGDRIQIDLRQLLLERNMADVLDYLTDLRIATKPGAIVLDVRGAIRRR
jgi:hypothetical protein